MSDYILDGKEVFLLCFKQGVSALYGIEDEYRGMSDEQKAVEMNLAWRTLERKGYIESDFDGNSVVDANLLSLLQTCIKARKMFLAKLKEEKRESAVLNYYIGEDQLVEVMKKEGSYTIRKVKKEEMQESVKQFCLSSKTDSSVIVQDEELSKKHLKVISALVLQGREMEAKKCLLKFVSAKTAEVILNVFKRKGTICSMIAVDYEAEKDRVCYFQYLTDANGSLRMRSKIKDLESVLEFIPFFEKDREHFIENACRSLLW